MNKKGTIFDGIVILLIILVFGILLTISLYFINTVNEQFQDDNTVPQAAKDITGGFNTQASWVFDFLGVMAMISLPIISLILAFFNNIHPLFFWASFSLSLIILIFASSIGDMWISITDDTLASTVARMPMMDWLLSNYGFYALFIIATVGFGVFVKSRDVGGYF